MWDRIALWCPAEGCIGGLGRAFAVCTPPPPLMSPGGPSQSDSSPAPAAAGDHNGPVPHTRGIRSQNGREAARWDARAALLRDECLAFEELHMLHRGMANLTAFQRCFADFCRHQFWGGGSVHESVAPPLAHQGRGGEGGGGGTEKRPTSTGLCTARVSEKVQRVFAINAECAGCTHRIEFWGVTGLPSHGGNCIQRVGVLCAQWLLLPLGVPPPSRRFGGCGKVRLGLEFQG